MNWSLQQKNTDLTRFVRSLIQFRKNQPTVRRKTFLTGVPNSKGWADVSWYSALGTAVDWHSSELPIICLLAAPNGEHSDAGGRDVLLMLNSSSAGCRFMIPTIARSRNWQLFIDTSLDSPKDIHPDLDGPPLPDNGSYTLPQKAMAVYIAS